MNVFRLPSLMVLWVLVGVLSASAQDNLLLENESAFVATRPVPHSTASSSANPKIYRSYKKLPQLYNGFAIEVASSNFPLQQSNPVFRQFGNLHYEKLREGGYSYLILYDFSSKEAALDFVKTIIRPKATEAILFEYKDGIRKAVRE